MPKQKLTKIRQQNQELFHLKINNTTILETENFDDCLDQSMMLIHGKGVSASAIDILSRDQKTELWFSIWEEVATDAPY